MQLDREKLKTLILYVCANCEPTRLGAVKLHKVLYFSDMMRYAQTGTPLTGAIYRKRPLGPTCDQLLTSLRDLEQDNQIRVDEVDYFGYRKKEFHALAKPDITRLNSEEIALIDEVVDFVCARNTARTISEYSHNRAWELAEFGEELKYSSAFLMFPSQVSLEAMDWAASEGSDLNADGEDELAGKDFASFREEILQRLGT